MKKFLITASLALSSVGAFCQEKFIDFPEEGCTMQFTLNGKQIDVPTINIIEVLPAHNGTGFMTRIDTLVALSKTEAYTLSIDFDSINEMKAEWQRMYEFVKACNNEFYKRRGL